MIAFPAGTKVWIAGGVTDMRCGMNSLALKIQEGLGRDPHAGEIFCLRGRKGAETLTLEAAENGAATRCDGEFGPKRLETGTEGAAAGAV